MIARVTRREGAALVGILALAAWFRLFDLAGSGFGNAYYAAAARSMLVSWHNFFFVSFDPVGFVSVDKPPLALWIQASSARLFGYSGPALLVPQVLEGLAAVALLHAIVRRSSGPGAGLLAALALALSPVSIATDRCNNVDSCLVVILLLAAWAFLKALENGRRRWLIAAFALIGLGFNTKMLAAFVLLPVLYALYLYAAPGPWRVRLVHLLWGSLALAVVSLSWPLAVDLTPAGRRPYVGSSKNNSVLGLALGWNGLQRMLDRPAPPPVQPEPPAERAQAKDPLAPGPLRLIDKPLVGQFGWLLPLGLFGLLAALRSGRPRAPWLLWAGWGAVYAAVFSFMRGPFHAYYLVLLAPPAAALFGAGTWALWERYQASDGRQRWLLVAFVVTALWQAWLIAQFPQWRWRLLPAVSTGVLCAVAGLMLSTGSPRPSVLPSVFLGLGITSILLGPALWSLGAIQSRNLDLDANPDRLGAPARARQARSRARLFDPIAARLLDYTGSNEGGSTLLAVPNCRIAAPLIVQAGAPVLALGGFLGSDPIVSVEQFARWVQQGRVRYAIVPGPRIPLPEQTPGDAVQQWIRSNGRRVDPDRWAPSSEGPPPRSVPWGIGLQLYDLGK
jgi:4-amino-4-deoxy-L-arabinose transferase-like glycosyltransferase